MYMFAATIEQRIWAGVILAVFAIFAYVVFFRKNSRSSYSSAATGSYRPGLIIVYLFMTVPPFYLLSVAVAGVFIYVPVGYIGLLH